MKVEIKISGPGGTFGCIAFAIKKLLEDNGAEVTIDEYYEDVDLPFEKILPVLEAMHEKQFQNRNIHIHLLHLPWGG